MPDIRKYFEIRLKMFNVYCLLKLCTLAFKCTCITTVKLVSVHTVDIDLIPSSVQFTLTLLLTLTNIIIFLTKILGHLSDTDICPTTEISFSDKRPCRKRIRKRIFVRKFVSIIFKTMLETMVYNVWVTGCSTVWCINVCLLV